MTTIVVPKEVADLAMAIFRGDAQRSGEFYKKWHAARQRDLFGESWLEAYKTALATARRDR